MINIKNQLLNMSFTDLASFVQNADDLEKLGMEVDKNYLIKIILSNFNQLLKKKKFRIKFSKTFTRKELSEYFGKKEKLSDFEYYEFIDKKGPKVWASFLGIEIVKPLGSSSDKTQETIEVDKHLFKFQNRVRHLIINFLNSEKNTRAIVQMPTGSGKTRTSLEAICDYLRSQPTDKITTVIWLAYGPELCEQAAESFEINWKRYGNQPADLIRMWGGKEKNITINKTSFIVIGLDTAYGFLKTQKEDLNDLRITLKKSCDILICDEAHQSVAETYKKVLDVFQTQKTKLIGLTATPGRTDSEEQDELIEFYESNLIGIVDDKGNKLRNPLKHLQKEGILSKINHRELKTNVKITLSEKEKESVSNHSDLPQEILRKLSTDRGRTYAILDKVRDLYLKKRKIIIFATTKSHSENLSHLIDQIYGYENQSITSDTNQEIRDQSIFNFKEGNLRILINYGVLTTGFDAPKTDAVIIARPTTSLVLYSQMIGRGLRGEKMNGTKFCDVYDVIDNIQNLPNISEAYKYFEELYK
tara:strand:- start:525 stop:2114 length:1590 start_codon:yes stop_codon:yes gene_type:complete